MDYVKEKMNRKKEKARGWRVNYTARALSSK
jgi:hypothetical protein